MGYSYYYAHVAMYVLVTCDYELEYCVNDAWLVFKTKATNVKLLTAFDCIVI